MVLRDSAAQHAGQDKLFLLLKFFAISSWRHAANARERIPAKFAARPENLWN